MSTTQINTPRGPIIAVKEDDLIYARGVRFATAERWQKPVPATWTTPEDCTKKSTICPQHEFRFEYVIGPIPLDRPMGEDCLRLSVVAPQNASKLPVVVWFHGGANISGGADIDLMDTSDIARLGVVTVSVQYRLGLYGCVEIPGLAEPNLHVYDQMESLKWVKENVEAFGGDPEAVTIMGQSAGGWAIYNMILAPTDGLFHRAIIISSPLAIQPKGDLGEHVKKRLPDSDILDIQADMLKMREGTVDDFTADRRRAPFPANPNQRIAERKDVDLLIGWTADDALPFVRLVPAGKMVTSWLGSTAEYWIGKAATEFMFKRPSQKLAREWKGNATTFEFQYFPEGSPFRACHCMEMPFLFNGWARWAAAPLMVGADPETFARMAPLVKDMFVSFAKHGSKKKHVNITESFSEADYK